MDEEARQLLESFRQLTPRQAEVLRLLVQGLAREEIARRLGVTPRVVVADIGVIYRAFALDESGLTPAQRRLELRRIVAVLRKLEREEAPPPPPPAAPASEPAAAERPTPLVLLPPPIPTPPASFSAWRWWPVAAALLLLAIVAGTWWVTHGAGQRALAGTTAISTTVTTPAVVVAAPTITPTVAPSPTPPPRPPASTATPPPKPTPSPTATATVNPAATPLNLAGKVASKRPGTPLRLGQPVASIIDQQAKPYDLYALQLQAGQTLHVQVTASSSAFGVTLAAPGAVDLIGAPGIPLGTFLCNFRNPCVKDFAIAADGAYTLVIGTNEGAGVRYTLLATAR